MPKRERENNPRATYFAIYFKADPNSDEVKSCATQMFEKNENVKKIQVYQNSIILRLINHQHLGTLQNCYRDSKRRIDVAEKELHNIPNQICVFYLERANIVVCPPAKPNHIIIFNNGRFQQKHEIGYCLSTMLDHMKSNSKQRHMPYDTKITKQKLLEAIDRIPQDFSCGCARKECKEKLQLFGSNVMSADRMYDDVGYSDEKQIITMVVKSHNTFIKQSSIPQEAASQVYWATRLGESMFRSTADRVKQLQKLESNASEQHLSYIDRFAKDRFILQTQYRASLERKRILQKGMCFKCETEMYFGDEKGIFREKNKATKVSPDRIDDQNVFYDDNNFNLVCCSCNFMGDNNVRRHIENKAVNAPVEMTAALLEQCKTYLRS